VPGILERSADSSRGRRSSPLFPTDLQQTFFFFLVVVVMFFSDKEIRSSSRLCSEKLSVPPAQGVVFPFLSVCSRRLLRHVTFFLTVVVLFSSV